jgi:Arc/MetJ family transcription regulator
MSKTTVIIDDKLLEEAMRVSGAKTKRQAITTGLRELIRRKNIEALRQELGTFDLALSLGDLEKLRNGQ